MIERSPGIIKHEHSTERNYLRDLVVVNPRRITSTTPRLKILHRGYPAQIREHVKVRNYSRGRGVLRDWPAEG